MFKTSLHCKSEGLALKKMKLKLGPLGYIEKIIKDKEIRMKLGP